MEDVNRSPLVTIESIRSHPCHSTPMFIILSKLPHVTGTSHRIKATSGLLAVQGCGLRYLGTPHHASQHRTSRSLRTGADLYGGILTPVDIVPLHSFFLISFLLFFLSCASRHAITNLGLKAQRHQEDAHIYYIQ
jgi:hypothetical protein